MPLLARKIAPEAVFCRAANLSSLRQSFGRQQNGTDFAFQSNFGLAVFRRFDGDLLHLADANTGGADGFHQERETVVARSFRRGNQSFIFCAR